MKRFCAIVLCMSLLAFVRCDGGGGTTDPDNPGGNTDVSDGIPEFRWEGDMHIYGKDVYCLSYNNYLKNGVVHPGPEDASNYNGSIYFDGKDVYVCGQTLYQSHTVIPCYWKNGGGRVDITDGTLGDVTAEGSWITVIGNDVYILGIRKFSEDVGDWHPCYWKNGRMQTLQEPRDGYIYQAFKMIVFKGDVYIIGRYFEFNAWTEGMHACYWKNGIINDRLEVGAFSWGADIFITPEGRLYIPGTAYTYVDEPGNENGIKSSYGYWENGEFKVVKTSLDTDRDSYTPYGISVYKNEVYMAGIHHRLNGNDTAIYWKGEAVFELTQAESEAREVYIAPNGDVYVFGFYGDSPCYWKGNERHDYPGTYF